MHKTSTQFLDKVNNDLRRVIVMAMPDFSELNEMIKSYYEQRYRYSASEIFSEEDSKIETVVRNLQFMDVLTQRVEHLILVHTSLEVNNDNPGFNEAFFHLHVFQSMTIELDLLKAVNTINATLEILKQHMMEVGNICYPDWKYFRNTSTIKEILNSTISLLTVAGGEIKHLPIPALTIGQIQMLNAVYTMESERVVLKWFLEAMPTGTREDLLHHYESAIHNLEVEKTELF